MYLMIFLRNIIVGIMIKQDKSLQMDKKTSHSNVDVALLTDHRFLHTPAADEWYLQNILKDDYYLQQALTARGISSIRLDWADPTVDWSAFKCLVFRTTWDYYNRATEFSAWLDKVAQQTKLCNPLDIIRWNMDKHYLADLEKQGIPIVPSVFLEAGCGTLFLDVMKDRGWHEAVIKPCIAGGARLTYRLNAGNAVEIQESLSEWLTQEAFILQPFMQQILEEGEDTLMVMNGVYTHAIKKRAKQGDFRVQDDYGGSVHHLDPKPEQIKLAEDAMAACGQKLAYGRVDMVQDESGRWCIMELEVIEPELWIRYHPESAQPFADGIVEILN